MKKPMSFSVNEELQEEFKKVCDARCINRSKWLEKQMYLLIKTEVVK